MSSLSFHDQLWIAISGPLVAGLIITVVGGFWTFHFVRERDARDANRRLGEALIFEMIEIAYPMYHVLQRYYRSSLGEIMEAKDPVFESAYSQFRTRAATIQTKLETYYFVNLKVFEDYSNKSDMNVNHQLRAHFATVSEPWTYWHALIDLITLDFFAITRQPNTTSDVESAVKYHVDLHGDELKNHNYRMDKFTECLRKSISSVKEASARREPGLPPPKEKWFVKLLKKVWRPRSRNHVS